MSEKRKIAFVGNSIVTMWNFRQTLIEALANDGYDITIIANADSEKQLLTDNNIRFIPIKVDSKGIDPINDIKLAKELKQIYCREKFDFIFHYTIKPVIYGSIAAHAAKIPSLAIITGLGYVFLQNNWLRQLVVKLYRYACQFPKQIWFLNKDDKQLFINEHIIDEKFADILDGEGVDVERFAPKEATTESFSFIYIGRLLWAKGVGEYVEAARKIHTKHPHVAFKILGGSDAADPSIDVMPDDIKKWESEGIITYLGETRDVVPYIEDSHCLVLPSYYREGVPRTLLEAASMGKPIITTDSIGCREAIIDQKSGFLCEPHNIEDLADKMEQMLLFSNEQRHAMGVAGRQLVLDRFDFKIVIDKYKQFLKHYFEPTTQYLQAQTSNKQKCINVSVVVYDTPYQQIVELIETLQKSTRINTISIINNSKVDLSRITALGVTYIQNVHNIGYGRAHNIALRKTLEQNTPYHLVVNPDIKFEATIFDEMIGFMEANSDIASLMPKVYYPDGELQYLCKLIPNPSNLFARRFLPQSFTKRGRHKFEVRHFSYNEIINIPFLSGCFMLMRTEALKNVGLFDERYFLYMEDVDLSRRLNQQYKTVFYPHTSIVHKHAHGSYNSKHLLWVHIVSSIRYFNKWGWYHDSERKRINQNVLEEIRNMQK